MNHGELTRLMIAYFLGMGVEAGALSFGLLTPESSTTVMIVSFAICGILIWIALRRS